MKHILSIAIISGLVMFSQAATASEITDTYTAGDTLTATHMDNIKSAVNDNNSKVDNNTTNKQDRVTGTCGPGEAIQSIAANGDVTCGAATVDFGSILSVVTVLGTGTAQTDSAVAECTPGEHATGGGCAVSNFSAASNTIKIDEPLLTGGVPTGWNCGCQADTSQTCQVRATVVCAQ